MGDCADVMDYLLMADKQLLLICGLLGVYAIIIAQLSELRFHRTDRFQKGSPTLLLFSFFCKEEKVSTGIDKLCTLKTLSRLKNDKYGL